MVEQDSHLDLVFGSLADATRRDILRRLAEEAMSVGEIAAPYDMSFAAVSKHLGVLERSRLVIKHRQGRLHIAALAPAAVADASNHLDRYREIWEARFDRLEKYLEKQP